MAEQGIPVSRTRINEILVGQQHDMILQLQQRVAELTAVNEALMERVRDHSNPASNGKALSEGINDSQQASAG